MQELFTSRLLEEVKPEKQEVEKHLLMTTQDQIFLEKLKGLIDKNMDNSDLLIDDLVKEMAVSRTIFFKKLKALTGLGPNEFVKEMRIKRAAQLLGVLATQLLLPRAFVRHCRSPAQGGPGDPRRGHRHGARAA